MVVEKEMATHSSILAWEIPWTEEPGGLQSMGHKESDMTERLHFHFQTMVEVMKIMVTSFKKSLAGTATLSAPNSAAGHRWPMPPPGAPGHSRASLGQSLVGSLLLALLGPGVLKLLSVPSKSLFPQSCASSGGSVVGLMATSSKRSYAIPGSAAPEPLALSPSTAELKLLPVQLTSTLYLTHTQHIGD